MGLVLILTDGEGNRLQASGFRLQASGFRLQASGFRLQGFKVSKVSDCKPSLRHPEGPCFPHGPRDPARAPTNCPRGDPRQVPPLAGENASVRDDAKSGLEKST